MNAMHKPREEISSRKAPHVQMMNRSAGSGFKLPVKVLQLGARIRGTVGPELKLLAAGKLPHHSLSIDLPIAVIPPLNIQYALYSFLKPALRPSFLGCDP